MSSVCNPIWYGVLAVVAYISSCGQCVLSYESTQYYLRLFFVVCVDAGSGV